MGQSKDAGGMVVLFGLDHEVLEVEGHQVEVAEGLTIFVVPQVQPRVLWP
jgi:hypothetical protein